MLIIKFLHIVLRLANHSKPKDCKNFRTPSVSFPTVFTVGVSQEPRRSFVTVSSLGKLVTRDQEAGDVATRLSVQEALVIDK